MESAASNIQSLRAKGVRVAIDDFGMGYSFLTYLRQFPVDVPKLSEPLSKIFKPLIRRGLA